MSTYVGIDVAKGECVVWTAGWTRAWTVANSKAGMGRLCKRLANLAGPRVALEATGGYEHRVVDALVAAGIPVAVVNPRRVRDFARALGRLAKTDAIDAEALAEFAQRVEPAANGERYLEFEPIRRLAARRRQLMAQRTREMNRREHGEGATEQSVARAIEFYDAELRIIEGELARSVDAMPELNGRRRILCTAPGIRETTAMQLLAFLPELGHASRREIAALAGLAPMNRDSGTMRGRRMTGGGRHTVRTILYMPTLCAIRYNPVLKAYYEKLLARGKPKMTAVTATMRKFLTLLNAMLMKEEEWKNA